MSISNFILKLLKMKDENIIIEEKIENIKIKSINYQLIIGKLSYTPQVCPKCGCINQNHSIIKYGMKASNIKLLPICKEPTILKLYKQRFLCKECEQTFVAKTNIVNSNCFISNKVKNNIVYELTKKISEKDIAASNFVSHATVSRIIQNSFKEFKPNLKYLPPNLMFDEFKSTKDAKGNMSFIFANSDSGKIIDILENRQLPYLLKYFQKYSNEVRNTVKTICTDIYSPYFSLIKDLFPNAKIILDRFHIVNLINRALQKTRVESMKKFPTNSMQYKRLKRYWKLILKDNNKLDGIYFTKRTHFKNWVSEKTLVEEAISVDPQLEVTYNAYQLLLFDVKNNNENCNNKLNTF